MRHYSPNRPNTLARVAALEFLAERAINPGELEFLNREAFLQRIGVGGNQFDQMVRDLCRELMTYGAQEPLDEFSRGSERIDALLREIRDPKLRTKVASLMLDVINADGLALPEDSLRIAKLIERWKHAPGGPVELVKHTGGWQSRFRHLTS